MLTATRLAALLKRMCEQLELLVTEVRPVAKRKPVKRVKVKAGHTAELTLVWKLSLGE